jgi:transposase-like protein
MTISFARHQFPPAIIRHAVWLHIRFTLSYRDIEDLLAELGLDVSYETVRRWVLKFGPLFAREFEQRRPRRRDRAVVEPIANKQQRRDSCRDLLAGVVGWR